MISKSQFELTTHTMKVLINVALLHYGFSIFEKTELRGDVWPKPQYISTDVESIYKFDAKTINFPESSTTDCSEFINDLNTRYSAIFQNPFLHYQGEFIPGQDVNPTATGKIENLIIEGSLKDCNVFPHLNMDESYEILMSDDTITIKADAIWGVVRAYETLSQMIWWASESEAFIFQTTVNDYARYKYRGFMLDTSRHFFHTNTIYQLLDGMAYNKLNVFHWHITDGQSFPYQSKVYPELSAKGAYLPAENHVYTIAEISDILEFARHRGIRVIPEFDTPGHLASWCGAFPDLCVKCNGNSWDKDQMGRFYGYGPFKVSNETNYEIMKNLFTELRSVFKDVKMHLGGDEVPGNCWLADEDVKKWADEKGFKTDFEIQSYHLSRMYDIMQEVGFEYMIWDEAFGVQGKFETEIILNFFS